MHQLNSSQCIRLGGIKRELDTLWLTHFNCLVETTQTQMGNEPTNTRCYYCRQNIINEIDIDFESLEQMH